MKRLVWLACLLFVVSLAGAQVQTIPPSGGNPVGQSSTCTDTQVLTCSSNTIAWGNSGSGAAIILDLGDDASNESVGLAEIATIGDTNNIFTEPAADKLLIDLTKKWPAADAATTAASASDLVCTGCVSSTDIADGTITDTDVATANKDGTTGTPSMRTLGTGATQAAAGDDARFPSAGEKAALAGTNGTPSDSVRYVTNSDPRLPSMSTPSALSASSQITCSVPTVYVAGSGGTVTLTDAAWIVAGTFTGQTCTIIGSHATNTVTAPSTSGVRLIGNTGSVVFGENKGGKTFQWTGSQWRQISGTNAAQSVIEAPNVPLTTCGNAANPTYGDVPGGDYWEFCLESEVPILKAYCNGVQCPSAIQLASGGSYTLKDSAGATIVRYLNDTKVASGPGVAVQTACQVITAVTAADDNMLFASFARATLITGVWCNYQGSAPTTPATFTLEDGSGNAMTITGTNPTCAAPGTPATVAAVTAGNALTAREVLRFDTTNTPNPATDTYMICVSYEVTD